MRRILLSLMLLITSVPATAQVTIGVQTPGVDIGINLHGYPDLIPVPGYPVYYASRVNENYFFYDGAYWVYQRDNWYASSWYNGPWGLVAPDAVPLYVLRVPVRYYRRPPAYFHGWNVNTSPRWGEHWGNSWEQRHTGWDNWSRGSVPAAAPLPVYQRQYSGNRYPHAEQQQSLQVQNYHYQPREANVQHVPQPPAHASSPAMRTSAPQGLPATMPPLKSQPSPGASGRESAQGRENGPHGQPPGQEGKPGKDEKSGKPESQNGEHGR